MKWTSRGLAGLLALSCTASFAQQLQLPEDAARRAQIRKLDLAQAEAIFKGGPSGGRATLATVAGHAMCVTGGA